MSDPRNTGSWDEYRMKVVADLEGLKENVAGLTVAVTTLTTEITVWKRTARVMTAMAGLIGSALTWLVGYLPKILALLK